MKTLAKKQVAELRSSKTDGTSHPSSAMQKEPVRKEKDERAAKEKVGFGNDQKELEAEILERDKPGKDNEARCDGREIASGCA